MTQKWSTARGEHAENFPENQRKFPTHGMETDEVRVVLEYSQQACEALMSVPIIWELIVRQGFPLEYGGAQNIPLGPRNLPQPRRGIKSILPGPRSFPQPRGRAQ